MTWPEKFRNFFKSSSSNPEPGFDESLETAEQYRQRWRSIYVVYFTMFIMSLGFSIIVTGVWPYLDKVLPLYLKQCHLSYMRFIQLDPTAGKEFMGFIVAANPFGQMIFSPLVGWWSNKLGSIRIPLIVSLLVFTGASAIYSCLELFGSNVKHWMLWSRFLVGVSSGEQFLKSFDWDDWFWERICASPFDQLKKQKNPADLCITFGIFRMKCFLDMLLALVGKMLFLRWECNSGKLPV